MTTEAVAGQDRLHILVEVNLPRTRTTTSGLLSAVTACNEEGSHKGQRDCQGSISPF